MKHIARTILSVLLVPLLLTGCKSKGFQDIALTSVRLVSIEPEGFFHVNAILEVGVHNPTLSFQVSDLSAVARFQGQDALAATAEPVRIPGHSDALYQIPLRGQLADGFNPFRLLRLLGDEASFDDVTLDVRARVSLPGGFGRNIELLDIPLSELLGGIRTENLTESNEQILE